MIDDSNINVIDMSRLNTDIPRNGQEIEISHLLDKFLEIENAEWHERQEMRQNARKIF